MPLCLNRDVLRTVYDLNFQGIMVFKEDHDSFGAPQSQAEFSVLMSVLRSGNLLIMWRQAVPRTLNYQTLCLLNWFWFRMARCHLKCARSVTVGSTASRAGNALLSSRQAASERGSCRCTQRGAECLFLASLPVRTLTIFRVRPIYNLIRRLRELLCGDGLCHVRS